MKKIISKELAELLQQMRGFRNILIHEYAVMDDEIVFDAVKNRLKDFVRFKKEILKKMKRY